MNYIITGHKGLIGRKLKEKLDSLGNKCLLEVDLRNKENPLDIDELSDKKIADAEIFFHLAANCKINKCISEPEWAFENVRTSFQVLEFCRKNNIKKIVFFSSARVLSLEENPYTVSKKYGENLCKAYFRCYGIEYIIIRPSTVYGPGEDPTNRLMHIWLNNAISGRDLEIYGDENKTLDFTYVDDFVEGVILSLDKWNEDYNIAGGREINLLEVAKEIIKQTNSSSRIVFKEAEKEQPQRVCMDISKIKEKGYNSKVEMIEGIKKCLKNPN